MLSIKRTIVFVIMMAINIIAFSDVFYVSPEPGDNIASGINLLEAMKQIGNPTKSNPYLIKLMPGIYDLGYESITLQPLSIVKL